MALCAELMELADMQDLGSCAARCEGSNPSFRIRLRFKMSKSLENGICSFFMI